MWSLKGFREGFVHMRRAIDKMNHAHIHETSIRTERVTNSTPKTGIRSVILGSLSRFRGLSWVAVDNNEAARDYDKVGNRTKEHESGY